MVYIYYEISIYIYKAIFPSGALPPNPRRGPAFPQTLKEGQAPLTLPHMEECTFFCGVKSSWGINTVENKDL
jgi:hypothetical protein